MVNNRPMIALPQAAPPTTPVRSVGQRRASVRRLSIRLAAAALLAMAAVPVMAFILEPVLGRHLSSLGVLPAYAQEDPLGTSYVTPFPANDTYQTLVIGDTFAEGILYGLVEAMGNDTRLVIQRKHRVVSGLMTSEHGDHLLQLDEVLAREPPHVAIVMLGEDDRQPVRIAGTAKRAAVGSDEWRAEYSRRADAMMKALKRRGAAVYWVGLPNLRRFEANEQAQMMNDIIRERAYLNGIKYIDAFAGFAEEGGGWSAYGPDLAGKMRLLRENDGVNFTGAGNRKLAHFVERELRRDLNQAKSERAIPLAGTAAEQEKIAKPAGAGKAATAAPATAGAGGSAPASGAASRPGTPLAPATPAPAATGEQKADNSRITLRAPGSAGREEAVQIDIVRPPIPASVVALVTRRESPDRPSQMGETLVDQIIGGLTVMSSIMPASGPGQSAGRARISPTQTPFYRVLVKGERLAPKPGRADDLIWPRPEPKLSASEPQAEVQPAPGSIAAPVPAPAAESAKPTVAKPPAPQPASRPARPPREPKG